MIYKQIELEAPYIKKIVDICLEEDMVNNDLTTIYSLDKKLPARFKIVTRQDMVLSGLKFIEEIFSRSKIQYNLPAHMKDGSFLKAGEMMLEGEGDCQEVLKLERTILNIIQHMSGIATLTAKFVDKIQGTKAKILDTRKTLPGLRMMQKYAVRCGGGFNHRFDLSSAVLLKDNHIDLFPSDFDVLLLQVKKNAKEGVVLEVECENLQQVESAVNAGFNVIMLDNMKISDIKNAVSLVGERCLLEVSGNVSLDNVREIALTGVNFISIGKLTHSVSAIDIGLDIKKI